MSDLADDAWNEGNADDMRDFALVAGERRLRGGSMSDNQNCDFAKAIGNGIVQHCTFVKGHIGKPHSYEAQPAAPEPLSPSPEIRRKVLEDALRAIVKSDDVWEMLEIARAALASPDTATTHSPEIRYQLRNWHHVTCARLAGRGMACTCLAQREALISELAAAEAGVS